RIENYHSRDAGLRCPDETTAGYSGPAQAHHSRYPERHREDGPAGRGHRLCGLAPRAMPGDHLVRYVLSVRPTADAPTGIPDPLMQPAGDRSNRPHRQLPHADAESEETLCDRAQIA